VSRRSSAWDGLACERPPIREFEKRASVAAQHEVAPDDRGHQQTSRHEPSATLASVLGSRLVHAAQPPARCFSIFAQLSRSPIVRLSSSASDLLSGSKQKYPSRSS
jgi:hypothetical protein